MARSKVSYHPFETVPVWQEKHRCHNNSLKLHPKTLHDTFKYFLPYPDDKTARFCQYSLCSIIMHQGVLEGGHYWCNVK